MILQLVSIDFLGAAWNDGVIDVIGNQDLVQASSKGYVRLGVTIFTRYMDNSGFAK